MKETVKIIIESLIRIYDKKAQDSMINIACVLNELEAKSRQFALPSEYANGFIDAIKEAKDKLKITNTFYELYQDSPEIITEQK